MADIFTVTAPLKARLQTGEQKVIAGLFRHPEGLLYFDLYWHEDRARGNIADHLFYVPGCHGTDGELATEFELWREWRLHNPDEYPDERIIHRIAANAGATYP